MAEAGSNHASEHLSGVASLQAYLALFVAHWFGARRFDRVGHEEGWDPEDVQAYHARKAEHLRRNFTRSKSVLVKADAEASGAAASEADQPAQSAETQGAEGGAGILGGSAGEEAAEARQASQAGQASQASQGSQGRDGETKVQIVTSAQARPWFVVTQCFVICLLWGAFALKKAGEDGMTGVDPWLAGLDSVNRGSTDLRWSGPSCEDYRPEIWRWITYQWTHIGVVHVLTNTIVLVLVGIPLEGHEGSFRLCFLFNTGVIAGALCFFLCEAHGYVVGCSGGIYALIGVHIEDLVMNWKERHFRRLTAVVLVFLLAADVVTWAVAHDMSDADYSYSAALGGSSAGVILGALIGRNYFFTKREKILVAVLSGLGVALVIFSLVWLGTNEAPLNIWEAAAGQDGWCWVKQFYNPALNATNYQCIRCGTQACIDEWSQQPNLLQVRVSACDSQGWFHDGR